MATFEGIATIDQLRAAFDSGCLIACRYRIRPELPAIPRLVQAITAEGQAVLAGWPNCAVPIDAQWVERWEAYAPTELPVRQPAKVWRRRGETTFHDRTGDATVWSCA